MRPPLSSIWVLVVLILRKFYVLLGGQSAVPGLPFYDAAIELPSATIQVWHEATEDKIKRLSEASSEAAEAMDAAARDQITFPHVFLLGCFQGVHFKF